MNRLSIALCFLLFACRASRMIDWPERRLSVTGTEFYQAAFPFKWQQRDSLVLAAVLQGDVPSFLHRFVAIRVEALDSATGRVDRAEYFVAPDYLSVGTDEDWARVNITPMAAQRIADRIDCFLPTRKMVDDIYKAAKVKLEPVPMYALRDSTPTMYHHHLIVEGQRRNRKGLIAGIQKDVVISGQLTRAGKADRVAIYGWHKIDGHPIQPLYVGHINWWVDYSQGIRFVYRKINVNGQWMDYTDVLKDPVLRRLLCDEQYCDFYKYPY
jgi:hypothetical protein